MTAPWTQPAASSTDSSPYQADPALVRLAVDALFDWLQNGDVEFATASPDITLHFQLRANDPLMRR